MSLENKVKKNSWVDEDIDAEELVAKFLEKKGQGK